VRGEIELLGTTEAYAYLEDVRERTAQAIESHGVGDGFVHEMVVRHELQHTETMRQTMTIAALLPAGEPTIQALEHEQRWIQIPAGPFQMGASPGGFSYDNERPAHPVQLDAFAIESLPVTNERWMDFCEGGGYECRQWWSPEGWEWKSRQEAHPEETISAGHTCHPHAAACHLSWFEAEAFARAQEARLPTEAEWEQARPALAGVGQVWEWTSSQFVGYPGFIAHPYREYSEVFFGDRYRVLRGGSWATSPRVGTATFRNWDLPERRQIFAGIRLARDEQ
jgi:iron(II)-dependent oxidoreductase